MYESELIQVYDQVFKKVDLEVEIVLNNRKILAGLAEYAGIEPYFNIMTIAIDKLDKIGSEGVMKEMIAKGIGSDKAEMVLSALQHKDIAYFEEILAESQVGKKGVEEIQAVFEFMQGLDTHNKLVFDPGLARGLNYYTGCIFEVKAVDGDIGGLGGGGRYDELTEVFGRSGMSGVGISFGAERIYDLMLEKDLFPENLEAVAKVLFVTFDEASHKYAFRMSTALRAEGIPTDIYPEVAKMKKQMKFANSIQVPFVAVVGEEERLNGQVALKNMLSGEQTKMTQNELISFFKTSK